MNSDSPQTNINGDVDEQVTIEANVADSATANEDGKSTTQVDTASSSAEMESLKAQLDERSSQYMRIAADFENYRKRTLKEKDDLELQVKRNTITELLPIIDNFERARAQIKPQDDGEMAIHKSYQGVYKQLVDCLKRLGVSPMRPEGQEFDPNEHEAVMREPTDEYPEGTVLEELVRGYFLGERVLRHAMVKVAAQKEDASSVEDSESGEAST
ncbi:MAG: nucleotide exchange factor GrpE [Cyanobacteriota bacterium]|nr:nucleotide exchange factor GrpE [Cyanobacteriota bacterium]